MGENTVLTAQEVAEMLKIAKNTVYELIKRGELNGYRVGKKLRVDLQDVIEYKNRTKAKNPMHMVQDLPQTVLQTQSISSPKAMSESPLVSENKLLSESEYDPEKQATLLKQVSNVGKKKGWDGNKGFVICGQDVILDILSSYLQKHTSQIQAVRSYAGSYNGLFALYHNEVQLVTVHLYDGETGEYNIPYVKRMVPGIPTVIVHLATRQQGFYVAKGNPKGIRSWEDLKRKDITMINRERGSGTRVLLDEKLKVLGIPGYQIEGYNLESTSHLTIASTVARGGADVGLGNEKAALQVSGVDFIPLQTEQLDLVYKKEDMERPEFKAVLQILNSREFQLELEGIGGYNISQIGSIISET